MSNFEKFVRDYTRGIRRDELSRLFRRDAAEAYRVLARDKPAGEEPENEDDLFFHRFKVLFLGISYRLTPARRLLFALSLIFFVLGLLDGGLQIDRSPDAWSVELGFSLFWSVLAFGSLLFLLLLELVDQVRVRDELEIARQLQQELLPSDGPALPGYEVAHTYRTANTVGGDYYDFLPLPDGRLALVVGDASGHGIAAGLVMAIANATMETAMDVDPSCAGVHQMLNRAIWRTGDRRTFMTLFFGILTPETGHLEYCCAGHPFPLLRRLDGGIEEIGVGGLPLGLRESLELRGGQTWIGEGESLLLYSDGLPEALGESEESFGFERLRACLAESGSATALEKRVLEAFDTHTRNQPLRDDLTLVVLRRGLPPPPPPSARPEAAE